MNRIHPTAIVDPRAVLADDVTIGPYVTVEGPVHMGAGTVIAAHSHLQGSTRIGAGCKIGPAAYVGVDPQHLAFVHDDANPTYLVVGDNTTIRETAIIHRAFKPGIEHATRIGNHCYLMGATHVGHDCVIDDHVIMAHGALLGGHVLVGARVFLGGGAIAHQFCRIGRLAIVQGNDAINKDVPPFGAQKENRLKGYNAVGCRRAGLSRDAISAIRAAYHCLHSHRTMPDVLAAIKALKLDVPEVHELVHFLSGSKRGIQRSVHADRTRPGNDEDDE